MKTGARPISSNPSLLLRPRVGGGGKARPQRVPTFRQFVLAELSSDSAGWRGPAGGARATTLAPEVQPRMCPGPVWALVSHEGESGPDASRGYCWSLVRPACHEGRAATSPTGCPSPAERPFGHA